MIYTLGEAVYDILFKNNQPAASVHGGSMYNVAISIGRAGKDVAFAGFYADDFLGNQSRFFLQQNGVSTECYRPVAKAKSNLALAFLNEQMVPEYNFYRDERLNGHPFEIEFSTAEFLVTGSFYAIDDDNFGNVLDVVEKSRQNNVNVVYDPNIRSKHLDEHPERYERIARMIELADLVKVSAEDLFHITGSKSHDDWKKYLNKHSAQKYILTQGAGPVEAVFNDEHFIFQVPEIDVVSSVGAGDGFTAGFVSYGIDAIQNRTHFELAVKRGISFAGAVCRSNENYIAAENGN